jgi:uncharacterized protein with NRDE domain
MCTVTYVPQGEHSFVLTTNRDEAPGRSPRGIEELPGMLFPRDTGAGGTWVAASADDRVVCVLNGAFTLHKRKPPYRLSRGIMALDFFSYKTAGDFFGQFDFTNIEPFTMVIYDRTKLFEYRWDGKKQYISFLETDQPYIWSSATLYDASARARREQWFEQWKEQQTYQPEAIRHFHTHAGDGDPWNDVIMNRNNLVRTVSITQVIKQKHAVDMHYFDLLRAGHDMAKMNIEGEKVVEPD